VELNGDDMDTQLYSERPRTNVRPHDAGAPDAGPASAVLDAARAARDEARARRAKVEQLLGKLNIQDARNSGGQ
jgi:hypothetical protein